MKCLEKDRTRRYETANALAADIERYRANEPVKACPPSALYRLQKTYRRNVVGFTAAIGVVISLILGVVVSTTLAIRARRAELEQIRLRAIAETTARELIQEKEAGLRIAKEKEPEKTRAEVSDRQLNLITLQNHEKEINTALASLDEPKEMLNGRSEDDRKTIPILANLLRQDLGNLGVGTRLLSELSSRQIAVPLGNGQKLPFTPEEVLISPDEKWLAIRSTNALHLSRFPVLQQEFFTIGVGSNPTSLVFSADSRYLLAEMLNGKAHIIDNSLRNPGVILEQGANAAWFTADSKSVFGICPGHEGSRENLGNAAL